ncbi:MAG: succinate dehydrogenase assembly factor 2 [Betaproteobacteria bacterium]
MERAEIEKLRWRCVRRGLLEVDIALSHFLETHFGTLSDAEQRLFVELADMEDHDLWHLISGQAECADTRFAPILALLRKGAVSKIS